MEYGTLVQIASHAHEQIGPGNLEYIAEYCTAGN